MRYYVTAWSSSSYRRGMVESWDGVVIKATPAFRWAIGRRIETVINHYGDLGWRFTPTNDPPMPSLSETPGAPTDAELAKRTRS